MKFAHQCNLYHTFELDLGLKLPFLVVIKMRYSYAFPPRFSFQNRNQLLCLEFYNGGRYGQDLRQSFQGFEPQIHYVHHDLDSVGYHRCVLRYCNCRRDSADHHSSQNP